MARRTLGVTLLCYLTGAIIVLSGLWANLGDRYVGWAYMDQAQMEWFLTLGARLFSGEHDPLFTTLGNAPRGINLVANTSVLGLALPLTPITLLFGPAASVAVALTLGLAGTAAAWCWFLLRHVTASPLLAGLGGAMCGFAPGIVSHANGAHLNFVSLWLVPFLAHWTLRLRTPGQARSAGTVLGLLIAYQYFISQEVLLLTAIGLALFLGFSWRGAALTQFLRGAGVALGVSGVILALPLWWQLFGPMSYRSLAETAHEENDLRSFTLPSSLSIGGIDPAPQWAAANPTEQNAAFGWVLLVAALATAVWQWRRSSTARAAALTAAVVLVLSLGEQIGIGGRPTGIPGPWRLLGDIPVLGILIPGRLALIAMPCLVVLLVIGGTELQTRLSRVPGIPVKILAVAAGAAIVLPIAPLPLATHALPPVPDFFAHGLWRDYVPAAGVIVSARPHRNGNPEPMRWQVATAMGFRNVEGYFAGPTGPDGVGWLSPDQRPTSLLLQQILGGAEHEITPEHRKRFAEDVAYWQADAVVLAPDEPRLRHAINQLAGPGEEIGGVWVWRVRQQR